MSVTSRNRYHEDYAIGQRIAHRRGHTVSTADNQTLSLLTMNTAQTHFNEDSLSSYMDGAFAAPLLNACVALALAAGLSSQDMTENALADLGYTAFRMPAPIFVGDTLYVASEVIDTQEKSPREDAGVLRYRITAARKVDGVVVLSVERRALIKRRSHWLQRDQEFNHHVYERAVAALTADTVAASASAPAPEPRSTHRTENTHEDHR